MDAKTRIDAAIEGVERATDGPVEADPIDDIHPESNIIKGKTWIALEVRNDDAEFICQAYDPAVGYRACMMALRDVMVELGRLRDSWDGIDAPIGVLAVDILDAIERRLGEEE